MFVLSKSRKVVFALYRSYVRRGSGWRVDRSLAGVIAMASGYVRHNEVNAMSSLFHLNEEKKKKNYLIA
jgi:hypothetical protein